MALETGSYISALVATNPTASDPKSQGDDHLRFVKAKILETFPSVTGAVTPTHTELNFVDGVTSGIQAQIDAKAPIASPTFTGTVTIPSGASIAGFAPLASPTFTGTPTAPTATVGTSTTQIATTAFVAATGLSTALPGQSGNAGKFITTDGTNASWVDPFAPGTAMLFAQTAAPTGWTKSTTHNDKALRVVSGTAGSGGSTAFTTVFASRTPAGSVTVDGTTLTESQMPAHTHTTSAYNSYGTGSFDPGGVSAVNYLSAASITSSSIGGGGSHTHTSSFAGTAMSFAVQYVDVIIATKD